MKPELIPVFRDMKHLHCSTPVGVDMYIVATLPPPSLSSPSMEILVHHQVTHSSMLQAQ